MPRRSATRANIRHAQVSEHSLTLDASRMNLKRRKNGVQKSWAPQNTVPIIVPNEREKLYDGRNPRVRRNLKARKHSKIDALKRSLIRRFQLWVALLTNLSGTGPTVNVITNCAERTRSRHSSRVSPGRRRGSTFQSRKSSASQQTASTCANLRPMHARGPEDKKQ